MIKRLFLSIFVMILIMWVSGCRNPAEVPLCYDTVKAFGDDCSKEICVYVINPCGREIIKLDTVIVNSPPQG